MEPFDPPFQQFYKNLFDNHFIDQSSPKTNQIEAFHEVEASEFELPLIDLSRLNHGGFDCEQCKREIAEASQQWGFFQVVNHGISWEILEKMRHEQVKAFKKPFHDKVNGNGHRELNFPADSYRWGTPSATCLQQLAWSEAFHKLAEILAEKLGQTSDFFKKNCVPSMCYIRMSRYPPCPVTPQVLGLMPHTDSDFLTILHQDQVGGLQLQKNGKWINYERFSTAYFLCPSYETVIESCGESSVYRRFSFREFRQQVQDDVKRFGHKIGLSRFIL
ncbi:Non-heme dioxygenase N-terminal domain-containing protein [Cynara cardunculus var. scolymus]|uniref:Non-heme dioxygenase N-terminal domain-containing protein n=1 Tax=Cynara cardunculus var. scolymus TaxID=59895 RepID=A0A103XV06_CYNCS|nr:Non-heme dioxygenase N-terminal domain-containing protein [Cynara cardunculus var. scolymus]